MEFLKVSGEDTFWGRTVRCVSAGPPPLCSKKHAFPNSPCATASAAPGAGGLSGSWGAGIRHCASRAVTLDGCASALSKMNQGTAT